MMQTASATRVFVESNARNAIARKVYTRGNQREYRASLLAEFSRGTISFNKFSLSRHVRGNFRTLNSRSQCFKDRKTLNWRKIRGLLHLGDMYCYLVVGGGRSFGRYKRENVRKLKFNNSEKIPANRDSWSSNFSPLIR